MVTPGAAEVTPPGAQAQHSQAATKHENVLDLVSHTPQKENTEPLHLAISVVVMMMIAVLLH